jgi:alkylated DNA repair dioxygenase AlkB
MATLTSLVEYLVIATVTSLSLLKPRAHRARHRERLKGKRKNENVCRFWFA